MLRRKFVPKLLSKSQFIIVIFQFRRLHETANLGSSIQISLLLGCILRLLLNLVKFRIVSREFLQSHEEVTKVESELIVLRVKGKESLNKGSNLWSIDLLAKVSLRKAECRLTLADW